MVVGLQHDEDILQHRYQDQRVDDQGQDAQDVIFLANPLTEGASIDIQRGRPNVTIYHSDALERQVQRPYPLILHEAKQPRNSSSNACGNNGEIVP